VKVSAGRVKVEHDDAVRVADQIGMPLHEVRSMAEAAWRADHPSPIDLWDVGAATSAEPAGSAGSTALIGHLHDGHGHSHDHPDPEVPPEG
jgi:hypothetical protein